MKKSDLKKVIRLSEKLNLIVEEIEELIKSEELRFKEMDSRKLMLKDRGNIIERNIQCLDIARVEINSAIEDLCTVLN